MSEKFEYKYSKPTVDERTEVNSIRNQYLPKTEQDKKIEELKRLDSIVKSVPMIWGLSFGIIGVLTFGAGLSFFLEIIEFWYLGIPLSIVGVLLMVLAYFVYKLVLTKYKNKYSARIIELSNDILQDK